MLPTLKSVIAGVFFMGLGLAHASIAHHAHCPSVDKIIAAGLSQSDVMTDVLEEKTYIAFHIDNYGTPWQWMFALAPLKANSPEEALKQGNDALPLLSGNPIPEGEDEDLWTCDYHPIHPGLFAMAITIPQGSNPAALLKRKWSH